VQLVSQREQLEVQRGLRSQRVAEDPDEHEEDGRYGSKRIGE
jgi:hypothetical protein